MPTTYLEADVRITLWPESINGSHRARIDTRNTYPVRMPILLLAKRVESVDQGANPTYDLCLGAFPTPPPSVNLETAVTSITYTETVENYRCLWDNFFAAPTTNHISCH